MTLVYNFIILYFIDQVVELNNINYLLEIVTIHHNFIGISVQLFSSKLSIFALRTSTQGALHYTRLNKTEDTFSFFIIYIIVRRLII